MTSLEELTFPAAHAAQAAELLARRAGLEPRTAGDGPAPGAATLDELVTRACRALDVDVEPVTTPHRDASRALARAAPALVAISAGTSGAGAPRVALLRSVRRGRATLIGPEGRTHRVPLTELAAAFRRGAEEPAADGVRELLADAGLGGRRRARAQRGLLDELVGERELPGIFLLRVPAHRPFLLQLRRAGLGRRLAAVGGAHLLMYGLWILAWFLVGRGALEGRFEGAWLAAWALALASLVPLRLLEGWSQSMLEVEAGALFKRRLLRGALHLEPGEVRHQGAGQHLSRVMESEAVESLALSAGFLGLAALIELPPALWILSSGAAGATQAPLFALWVGVALALAWSFHRKNREWVAARLDVTHDLVERLVGHRTRLAQEAPADVHRGEDELADRYLRHARGTDERTVWLGTWIPGGWIAVGLLGMAPALAAGTASVGALAVSLGGLLLGQQALAKLTGALTTASSLAVAWRQAGPLFRAGARREPEGTPEPALAAPASGGTAGEDAGGALLDVRHLTVRRRTHGDPVIRDADLRVRRGDRLSLEGPSGSGKSTLVAAVLGLVPPESGLVLIDGLDRDTWGAEAWRGRVAAAPQFHENHVLAGSLAFNLLFGRAWPPAPEDLAEAEEVCRDLGLGPLVDAMPAGLREMVGEAGWRLSHGECARLFVARALLQGADLVILDESFGALDAENRRRALACAAERAPALLVVSHP